MLLRCKSVVCLLLGVLAIAIVFQPGQINGNSLNRKIRRNYNLRHRFSEQSCTDGWVYLRQYHKCYELGTQGTCGERMMLSTAIPEGGIIRLDGIPKCRCELGSPPLIYWRKQNRCYGLFEQGPCPSGEWLVPTKRNGRCERNPCQDNYNRQENPLDDQSIGFLFSYEGQCYNSNVRYQLEGDSCPTSKVGAYFTEYYFWKHECFRRPPNEVAPSLQSDPVYDCRDGLEPGPSGGCER